MLKALSFTQNKLRLACFAKILEKIFWTDIHDKGTREILLIVVLIVGLSLDS